MFIHIRIIRIMKNSFIEKNESEKKTNNSKPQTKTIFLCIIIGVLLGVFLKFFVIDVLHVKGASMEPTISNGKTIVVNKLAYGIVKPFGDNLLVQWSEPHVNDIVIFLYNNNLVVKRCIATSGTTLEYSSNSGYNLTVAGKNIPLTDIQYHKMKASNSIPEGMILAVGDNYKESIDSRNYGFISTRNIIGKVICK